MTTKARKEVKRIVKQRNKYTGDQKKDAKKYYLMGLNLTEISKLLDGCPVRTLEKWQQADNWTALKKPENIKHQTMKLHKSKKRSQTNCISKPVLIFPISMLSLTLTRLKIGIRLNVVLMLLRLGLIPFRLLLVSLLELLI